MLLSLWSLVNKDHMVHGMLPLEYNHYVVRKPRPRGGATTGQRPQLGLLWHKHCFLGRLIRSPGVPKERGVGVLEEEIGVWNSQGGGKDNFFFFFSTFLGLINIKCFWVFFFFFFFFFKPGTDDYTTQFKLCERKKVKESRSVMSDSLWSHGL